MLVAQSCPTLCNPVDCSPPGSSVHEILQVRILEWVAISLFLEKEMQDTRVQSPGQEDPLEKKKNGYTLQYSCLANPMDRGGWRVTVHGVTKSQT